jgi:hypothetical protein
LFLYDCAVTVTRVSKTLNKRVPVILKNQ